MAVSALLSFVSFAYVVSGRGSLLCDDVVAGSQIAALEIADYDTSLKLAGKHPSSLFVACHKVRRFLI